MSSGYVVTTEEDDMLRGLPWAARILYHWMLARRDIRTGLVGARRGWYICWQALREVLHIDPHSGCKFEYPDVEYVRRQVGWLVRAGLVIYCSDRAKAQLVFSLPMAKRLPFVQKQPDRNPTGQPDRQPDRLPHREPPPQPDREPDRVKGPQPDKHRLDVPSTTTTSTDSTVGESLIVPPAWPAAETATIRTIIRRACLNGRGQLIIDELIGAEGKTAIQSRTGFVSACIERMKNGTFAPERGKPITAARERSKRAAEERSKGNTSPPTAPVRSLAAEEIRRDMEKRRAARGKK